MRRRRDTADQLLLAGRFVARETWSLLECHAEKASRLHPWISICGQRLGRILGEWLPRPFWNGGLLSVAILSLSRTREYFLVVFIVEGNVRKESTRLSLPRMYCWESERWWSYSSHSGSSYSITLPESMTEVMTTNVYPPKHSMLDPHFHTTWKYDRSHDKKCIPP